VDGTPLQAQGAKDPQADPIIGKSIKGRYQILSKLGEGGRGTVYLADQVAIGRKVALKLLRGNYARDQEFIAGFRREARLAASLNTAIS
jgi:serine/threonine-protein kinase